MNRIKELRKRQGLNQKELSTILKVNVPTISKYESGDVDISASKLKILSRLFGTSIDYILGNDKEAKTESPLSLTLSEYNTFSFIAEMLKYMKSKKIPKDEILTDSGLKKIVAVTINIIAHELEEKLPCSAMIIAEKYIEAFTKENELTDIIFNQKWQYLFQILDSQQIKDVEELMVIYTKLDSRGKRHLMRSARDEYEDMIEDNRIKSRNA